MMAKSITYFSLGIFLILALINCDKKTLVSPGSPNDHYVNDPDSTQATVDSTVNDISPDSTLHVDSADSILGPNMGLEKFTVSDFERIGIVYRKSDIGSLLQNGVIGQSPEKALTPLAVSQNGHLLDTHQYNVLIQGNKNPGVEYRFTDLITFRQVTKYSSASAAYAKILPLSASKGVWIYDSYQRYFQPTYSLNKRLNAATTIGGDGYENCLEFSTEYYAGPGNIFVNPSKVVNFQSNSFPGHCAGSLFTTRSWQDWNHFINNVGTVEAQGYGFQGYSELEQVHMLFLEKNWQDDRETMFVLRPAYVSGGKQYDLGFFWMTQAKAYSRYKLEASKDQITEHGASGFEIYKETYCSLLMWHAYRDVLNRDIDPDGGYWCTPDDILNGGCNKDHWWSVEKISN